MCCDMRCVQMGRTRSELISSLCKSIFHRANFIAGARTKQTRAQRSPIGIVIQPTTPQTAPGSPGAPGSAGRRGRGGRGDRRERRSGAAQGLFCSDLMCADVRRQKFWLGTKRSISGLILSNPVKGRREMPMSMTRARAARLRTSCEPVQLLACSTPPAYLEPQYWCSWHLSVLHGSRRRSCGTDAARAVAFPQGVCRSHCAVSQVPSAPTPLPGAVQLIVSCIVHCTWTVRAALPTLTHQTIQLQALKHTPSHVSATDAIPCGGSACRTSSLTQPTPVPLV